MAAPARRRWWPGRRALRPCLYAVLAANVALASLQMFRAHAHIRLQRGGPWAGAGADGSAGGSGVELPSRAAFLAARAGERAEVVDIDAAELRKARLTYEENARLARLRDGGVALPAGAVRHAPASAPSDGDGPHDGEADWDDDGEADWDDDGEADWDDDGGDAQFESADAEAPRRPLREYAFEIGGVSAVHVLVTTLLLGQANLPALVEARLRLFTRLTVPSVKRQGCCGHAQPAPFLWLVYADPALPADVQRRLVASLRSHGHFLLLFTRELVFLRSVSAQLRFASEAVGESLAGLEHADRYISTRLDSDDALAADYVRQVQLRLPLMAAGEGGQGARSFSLFVCASTRLRWASSLHNLLHGELRRVGPADGGSVGCVTAGLSLLTVGYFNASVLALPKDTMGAHNTEVLPLGDDWALQTASAASAALDPRAARDMFAARAACWDAASPQLLRTFGITQRALRRLNVALVRAAPRVAAELLAAAQHADAAAAAAKKRGAAPAAAAAALTCGKDGTIRWSRGSLPCSHDAKGAWRYVAARANATAGTAVAAAVGTAGGGEGGDTPRDRDRGSASERAGARGVSLRQLLAYYELPSHIGPAVERSAWLHGALAPDGGAGAAASRWGASAADSAKLDAQLRGESVDGGDAVNGDDIVASSARGAPQRQRLGANQW